MVAQDVITKLRRGYDELTLSQKRIAEAIVEDPEFVAFATVDKLAARLGVSPSTVVRFAYRIGLNGYQELQDRVRQRVRSQMRSSAPVFRRCNGRRERRLEWRHRATPRSDVPLRPDRFPHERQGRQRAQG